MVSEFGGGEESAGELHVPLLRADPGPGPNKRRGGSRSDVLSGSDAWRVAPLVSVVNFANTGQSDNFGRGCSPALITTSQYENRRSLKL